MLRYGRFSFVEAKNEEIKKKIYQLRYEVYVKEFGFEKPEDHPGGLETDEYEKYSKHFAAIDDDGEVIGTIRLVLCSEKGFPIEHATKVSFIGEKPPPEKIAEISRLAVSKKYRRRREDGMFGVESYLKKSEGGILPDSGPVPRKHERRKRPVIVLGLFQIMYHASKRLGLSHWYMITEKKIYYMLKKFGFLFHQIGEPVEYHGLRIPYLGIINEIEQDLIRENPVFLKMILRGLEKKYHPEYGAVNLLKMYLAFPYYSKKALRYWQGIRR